MSTYYQPVFELKREQTVESLHYGAVAVVDVLGRLIASYGDPNAVTFLRSSAKPLQLLPFLESGGQQEFGLSDQDIAIMCASHSGTDEHVNVVRKLLSKTGFSETDLLCGVHPPIHKPTAQAMRDRGEQWTSIRHNCSGKHTGMLAFMKLKARRSGGVEERLTYIDRDHPIQRDIMQAFAEMCSIPVGKVILGVDGCSAPIFAASLQEVALGYARLCDPKRGGVKPQKRVDTCAVVVSAMTAHPFTVGGPGRFDSHLMEVAGGRLIAKGGAEGYQCVGLLPGALGPDSPAIGIAIKISDGDRRGKVHGAVTIEVLRQLGALSQVDLQALADFGPDFPLFNWRDIVVGKGKPVFMINLSRN